MKKISANIVIIGSGVAGGVIASGLLEKNLGPILMLEAGDSVLTKDPRTWLNLVMGEQKPYEHLSDITDDYQAIGSQKWVIEGGRLIVRGGSTMHWGGWCPRMKPEDFELKSRVGKGGLDWPFTYEDLEPYYVAAENYLQVAGDSTNHDPFRSAAYPFEAPTFSAVDKFIIDGLDRLQVSHIHLPISRNAKPINGMPACITTGTCNYCPIEARFTGSQPIDRLQAKYKKEDFELRTLSVVRKIIMYKKSKAYGVEFFDLKNNTIVTVNAEKIIICAGSLETAKLLLASTSKFWTNGIGNDTDNVGRHIIANPYFYFEGKAKHNLRKLQEELFIPTLGSRHWDTPEFQKEGKFFLNKAFSPDLKIANKMLGSDLNRFKAAMVGEQSLKLEGTIQTFSHHENRITLESGLTRFGLPRTKINTPVDLVSDLQMNIIQQRFKKIVSMLEYTPGNFGAYPQRGDHAMCTTRMSQDPNTGVVDQKCKIHGLENIFVISNSVFPSGAAANPTLTLVALAFKFLKEFK